MSAFTRLDIQKPTPISNQYGSNSRIPQEIEAGTGNYSEHSQSDSDRVTFTEKNKQLYQKYSKYYYESNSNYGNRKRFNENDYYKYTSLAATSNILDTHSNGPSQRHPAIMDSKVVSSKLQ